MGCRTQVSTGAVCGQYLMLEYCCLSCRLLLALCSHASTRACMICALLYVWFRAAAAVWCDVMCGVVQCGVATYRLGAIAEHSLLRYDLTPFVLVL